MRTYLREFISFGQNSVITDRANAVMSEGIDSFEAFLTIKNHYIKYFYSTIHNPGGLIPNTAFGATAVNPVPVNIINPEIRTPVICEARPVQAAYRANPYSDINREITPKTLSVMGINPFLEHKVKVDNNDNPESFTSIGKNFVIMKMLEQFPTLLE